MIAAENGLKAWDAFQKDVFPVLILDWLMPEMDGLALCRQVRTLVRENYTYIVLSGSRRFLFLIQTQHRRHRGQLV